MATNRTIVIKKKKLDEQLLAQPKDLNPTEFAIAARRQEEILKDEQRRIASGGQAPTALELDEWESEYFRVRSFARR